VGNKEWIVWASMGKVGKDQHDLCRGGIMISIDEPTLLELRGEISFESRTIIARIERRHWEGVAIAPGTKRRVRLIVEAVDQQGG